MSSYQLPEGYKQTEVGVIPEDWVVLPLSELCRTICDGTHYTPKYVPEGIPFYSVENITARNFTNTKYISEQEHAELIKRCKPERGDILMTRITAGIIGDTWLLDWDVNASIYVSLALLKPNERVAPEYLYRYSKSSAFVRDVEKRALINATPKKINMADIGAIPIPAPISLEEQRAIATALSDVDALIATLDKLIAKQRHLKTATMQQLLTGKKRLPGFGEGKGYKQTEVGVIPEDWPTIKIGDVFGFKNGLNKAKEFFGTGTPIVNYMDVFNHQGLYKSDIPGKVTVSADEIRAYEVRQGDVFFTRTSETVDEIGISSVLLEDVENSVFSGFVLRARPKSPDLDLDLFFKKYCFDSEIVRKQITSTSSYTTRALTNGRLLSQVILPCPREVEEQRAIATVLSDMDGAISALEARRAKTQAIKQGMMQQLLTGKVRLLDKGIDN